MSTSLKSFLPLLGTILNDQVDTLYERQRALVREGLLVALPGRGRGSGVVATPDSVAILLIGRLASVNLADAGLAARSLVGATPEGDLNFCPLTGAANFKSAVSKILADPKTAKKVQEIRIAVTHGSASIGFGSRQSDFIGKNSPFGLFRKGDGINMEIAIGSAIISKLTDAVADMVQDTAKRGDGT